jgi:hypothetical protein
VCILDGTEVPCSEALAIAGIGASPGGVFLPIYVPGYSISEVFDDSTTDGDPERAVDFTEVGTQIGYAFLPGLDPGVGSNATDARGVGNTSGAANKPTPPTTFLAKLKAGLNNAGFCTKLEVVGGLGVIGGGGLFLLGTAEDLTVVGLPAGLITQGSGAILATVGGATAALGTIGKDLGVCE